MAVDENRFLILSTIALIVLSLTLLTGCEQTQEEKVKKDLESNPKVSVFLEVFPEADFSSEYLSSAGKYRQEMREGCNETFEGVYRAVYSAEPTGIILYVSSKEKNVLCSLKMFNNNETVFVQGERSEVEEGTAFVIGRKRITYDEIRTSAKIINLTSGNRTRESVRREKNRKKIKDGVVEAGGEAVEESGELVGRGVAQLIDTKLVLQRAGDVFVSDEEVDRVVTSMLEAQGLSREEFDKRMEELNLSKAEYKAGVEESLKASKFLHQLTSDIVISSGEAERFYKANKELFNSSKPEEEARSFLKQMLSSQKIAFYMQKLRHETRMISYFNRSKLMSETRRGTEN